VTRGGSVTRTAVPALLASLIAPAASATTDFTRDIAPIVERCCLSCHRAGGPGAYPLENAAQVKRVARTMLQALESRTMPPWSPSEGVMRVPPRPSVDEIARVRAWVAEGAPVGDAAAAAREIAAKTADPRTLAEWRVADGWTIGAEERRVMRSFQFVPARDAADAGGGALAIGGWRVTSDAPGLVSTMLVTSGSAQLAQSLDERDASIGFKFTGDLDQRPSGALAGVGIDGAFALPAGFAMRIGAGDAIVTECHADGRGRTESGAFTLRAVAPVAVEGRALRMVRPSIVSSQGAAREVHDGARVMFEMPPLERALDLAAIVLRPGPDAVTVELAAIAADSTRTVLARVDRYDIHTDRPYVVDPVYALARGTRLVLTVDALNEILAARATPQAVLLVSDGVEKPAETAANKPPAPPAPPTPPAPIAAQPLGPATTAWLATNVRASAGASRDESVRESVAKQALLCTPLVTAGVFRELLGYDAEPRTGATDAAGFSWFEAIALCNELSRREGLAPAYRIEFAQRETLEHGAARLVGAVVTRTDGNGWALPTDAEWRATFAARDAISGTLWNWTSDTGRDTGGDTPTARIVRGGCWADRAGTQGIDARSAVEPSTRNELFGARLVRSVVGTQPANPR